MSLVALLFPMLCVCQYNLVPNYSFEDSVICPNLIHYDPLPRPWYIPSNFRNFFYVNSCSQNFLWGVPYNGFNDTGYQYPKTGNGYAAFDAAIDKGLPPNSRTYLQVKLKEALRTSKCYYCEFWVNLVNSADMYTNNISMLLTNSSVYSDTIFRSDGLNYIPGNAQIVNYGNPVIHDTLNWVKVSGVYMASGGEQYITIGNFNTDANTVIKVDSSGPEWEAVYLVDDVSVIPLDSMPLKADAGRDTVMTVGDSVFVGSLTNGIPNITWYNSSGTIIKTGIPGFYVKPASSTFYVIQQTVCGYTSRDTIYITVKPLPLKWMGFTAQAIDSKVQLQWQTANEENVSHFIIQRSTNGRVFVPIGKVYARNGLRNQYQFTDVPAGALAYYRLESVDRDGVKSYSEVRKVEMAKVKGEKLEAYPNPASDRVFVAGRNITEVKLLDNLGRVVLSRNVSSADNISIDVSRLAKGLYLLQVRVDGKVENRKMVRE